MMVRGLAALLAGAIAALLLLAACDETEESLPSGEVNRQPTATRAASTAAAAATPTATEPTPTATTAGSGGDIEGTVVPVPSPKGSPQPVPREWRTFEDPEGRFTFRYPKNWYPDPSISIGGELRVMSWNPATWTMPWFPAGGVMVRVSYNPIGETEPVPAGSTATIVGGSRGWEFLRLYQEATDCNGCPPPESARNRDHVVVVDHGDTRFYIIATFAGTSPDEATFSQILTTFAFTK